jgi:hypothetical protein
VECTSLKDEGGRIKCALDPSAFILENLVTLAHTLMDCTLYIPCLLPPDEALWRKVDAPQLTSLLARATMTDTAATSEAWLCGAFGIARQQDFPLAPLLAARENIDAAIGYWINATPAHIEARRTTLVLTDPEALHLSAEESAAFAGVISEHLRAENITLRTPRPGCWFLHTDQDQAPAINTTSPAAAIGRDLHALLPQGRDSARWHRILTEIQMLLHAHPLNAAREARGEAPVNSVWLWGGGTLPPSVTTPFTAVWSGDVIVSALARHGGRVCEPPPATLTPEILREGSHFYSLELLEAPWRRGDAPSWTQALTALDRDWFTPLLDALRARRMRALTIATNTASGMRQFVIRPRDLWNVFKILNKNKYYSNALHADHYHARRRR